MTQAQEGLEVRVYRSERRADTYLYLPVEDEFDDLPEALLEHFGPGTGFLQFWLHEERYLAQADPRQVLQAISDKGFYLQLPPNLPPKDAPSDV